MMSLPRMGALLRRYAHLLLLLLFYLAPAHADAQSERRLLMGLKLFPAVVSADQDLADKRGADGRLHLILLYQDNASVAADAAKRLVATQQIRDIPVQIGILHFARLNELDQSPAALFLVDSSPDALSAAVRFGITHHRLVFSPHLGDVGNGAMAGVFISDRILPLVNLETLNAAGIRLKPFLLGVAKTHE